MKHSVAIVGCGRVGTVLARHMARIGYRLTGLASKSLSSAQKAAEKIGIDSYSDTPWEVTKTADIVFITTPDGIIEEACKKIADNNGFKKNAMVLHCSGSLPSTILSSAKMDDISIGSMHPLQSFASVREDENPFNGIIIAVEGEAAALKSATDIADELGGISLTIKTEAKTFYHAAAVVASNYLVTLQDFAFKLLETSGIPNEDAFKVLGPLINGTIGNIKKVGTVKALTGPIARGDAQTVKSHVDEIKEKTPELFQLYQVLGLYTIPIAKAAGSLTDAAENELKELLT